MFRSLREKEAIPRRLGLQSPPPAPPPVHPASNGLLGLGGAADPGRSSVGEFPFLALVFSVSSSGC
jgi:hypothetical protein